MRLIAIERDGIIRRTIEGAFKARREKLAEKENALAEKVYQLIYPQDITRKMNQLPEEFFQRSTSVYLMEVAA